MSTSIMLLVLFAAFLHASWNAIVKSGGDKLREAGLVAGGGALVSLIGLPFVPLPSAASLPWLAASTAIHHLYYVLVAASYREGDMGHAYPLMRGTAPLLVALASGPLIGELLSPLAWLAILLICGGILLLAFHRHAQRRATMFALATAVVIASYTLFDGLGARASGNSVSYVLWLTVFSAPGLIAWLVWDNAPAFVAQIRQRGPAVLAGGAFSLTSYGLALFAMTLAPVAMVAALREVSVLFAMAISMLVLRETGSMARVIAAALIVAGAVTLRLT